MAEALCDGTRGLGHLVHQLSITLEEPSMHLFWQITTVEFPLNLAMFAGALLFYGPMRRSVLNPRRCFAG